VKVTGDKVTGLILCYARIKNCLDLIRKIRNAGCDNVYVYIDGPKSEDIKIAQTELLRELEVCAAEIGIKIFVRKSVSNRGIAVSMIHGLDWFFAENRKGFILEDDLVISSSFIPFIQDMLTRYENDSRVFMVSGNRYLQEEIGQEAVSWCNYPQTWGWATWSSRWAEMRNAYLNPPSLSSFFPFSPARSFWAAGSLYVKVRKVDTWDIPIARYMRNLDVFCLLPPKNLVSNIGSDYFATHTTNLTFPMDYPKYEISDSNWAVRHDIQVMRSNASRMNHFLEKYVFHIKRKHVFLFLKSWKLVRKQNHLANDLKKETECEEYIFLSA